MYVEGISDLMQLILVFPFSPPEAKEKNLATIAEKATERYFPVFEKVRDRKDVPRKLAFTTIRNFPKSKNMPVVQLDADPQSTWLSQRRGNDTANLLFVSVCCQGCNTGTATKQTK